MATSAHKPKLAARKATETLPEGEFEYRVAILGALHVYSSAVVNTFVSDATRESVSEQPKETAPPRATRAAPTPEHAS